MKLPAIVGSNLLILLYLSAALRVCIAAEVADEDWPQLLGPRANGISTETGLLEKWPITGPPVVWDKTIGTGYGAPSVRGERLVLHHRLGDEEIVECFDAATGKSLWRYGYPSHYLDPYGYNNGPRGSPLLASDRCYTFGAEGKLLCLDLKSGKLVWQRDTAKEWEIPRPFWCRQLTILEGDLLLVMVGGQSTPKWSHSATRQPARRFGRVWAKRIGRANRWSAGPANERSNGAASKSRPVTRRPWRQP
jgi:hypothetical protein